MPSDIIGAHASPSANTTDGTARKLTSPIAISCFFIIYFSLIKFKKSVRTVKLLALIVLVIVVISLSSLQNVLN